MKFFPYLSLGVFLTWAASVTRTDLASKKIPNSRLALGAWLLLAALGIQAANSVLGWRGESLSYLTRDFYLLWSGHVLWALLAGIVLWYGEVWPAGDAKFYILVAAWLPVIDPSLKNFPNYLFLSLLVNIFVAAALTAVAVFIAAGLYRSGPVPFLKGTAAELRRRFSLPPAAAGGRKMLVAAYFANLSFFFLVQQVMNSESRHFLARFLGRTDLLYLVLFFLWEKLGGLFRSKKWMYVTGGLYALYFAAGYFFFRERLAGLLVGSLLNVFRFSLLLFLGRSVLEFLMEKKDTVFVGPDELAPGMVLSSSAARALRENPVFDGAFSDCFKDGLSPEQASQAAAWLRRLPVEDPKIEIVKGRPFALWILSGAAITLLFDTNLVKLLKW